MTISHTTSITTSKTANIYPLVHNHYYLILQVSFQQWSRMRGSVTMGMHWVVPRWKRVLHLFLLLPMLLLLLLPCPFSYFLFMFLPLLLLIILLLLLLLFLPFFQLIFLPLPVVKIRKHSMNGKF